MAQINDYSPQRFFNNFDSLAELTFDPEYNPIKVKPKLIANLLPKFEKAAANTPTKIQITKPQNPQKTQTLQKADKPTN